MTNGDKDNFALLRYLLSPPESIPQKLRIRRRILHKMGSEPFQSTTAFFHLRKNAKRKNIKGKINEKWEKVVGQRSIERKSIDVSYAEEA